MAALKITAVEGVVVVVVAVVVLVVAVLVVVLEVVVVVVVVAMGSAPLRLLSRLSRIILIYKI